MGTVTIKTEKGEISPQFSTFYLHPEVNAGSKDTAERAAKSLLNPTNDPNVTPNVTVNLVTVASVAENPWTDEDLRKMDPNVGQLF